MTANQTKKLMVKAKAMYHIGDLSLTIRRGEVVELSEADANKSNDLWRGQQFGLLEVKWVYAGQQVAVPKTKTVPVESKAQVQAHTQQLLAQTAAAQSPAPATQQEVQELRQSIRELRSDLTVVSQQAAKAKAELQGEIAKLEAKLTEMEKQPPKLFDLDEPKAKRGPKPKEATDAGME